MVQCRFSEWLCQLTGSCLEFHQSFQYETVCFSPYYTTDVASKCQHLFTADLDNSDNQEGLSASYQDNEEE